MTAWEGTDGKLIGIEFHLLRHSGSSPSWFTAKYPSKEERQTEFDRIFKILSESVSLRA